MRVIINADDFGYSKTVNFAIENAIKVRRVSSATIIANSPCYEEAVKIAQKYTSISYGVHLNVIEFAPLTDNGVFKKYGLVDENGNFVMGAVFALRRFPNELKIAIKEEWKAQIRKVTVSGINISHIDSHQHTHTILAIEDVFVELLKELHIERVRRRFYISIPRLLREKRFTKPQYKNDQNEQRSLSSHFLYKLCNHLFIIPCSQFVWIRKISRYVKMTDDVFVYQIFVQEIQYGYKKYRDQTIEVECHPGLLSNTGETEWLMLDKLREYAQDYQLISYNEI